MANPASPQNTNGLDLDPLVLSSGSIGVKRGVVSRAISGIDPPVMDMGVATHKDDAAFVPGTDPVVVLAGMADQTSPDSVDEGDAGALRMTLARMLATVSICDTATLSNQASAATSATIIAANVNRIGLLIFNDDANALLIKYGATASATSYTVSIPAGGYWEMPSPVYRGIIDGIWAADGAGSARVTELT